MKRRCERAPVAALLALALMALWSGTAAGQAPEAPGRASAGALEVARGHEQAGAWKNAAGEYRSLLERGAAQLGPSAKLRARVGLGNALWQQGPAQRERAVAELRAALEPIERGRVAGDTVERRHVRDLATLGLADTVEGRRELAACLDAVARARYVLAGQELERFLAVKIAPFRAAPSLSAQVRSWYAARRGRDVAAEFEQALRTMSAAERRDAISGVQYQYWIERSFAPWREEAARALEVAEAAYLAAFDEEVPEWQVAAAASVGDLHRAMATAIADMPIDPSISGDQELLVVYRDALDGAILPIRQRAIAAYQRCADEAADHGVVDDRRRGCERALREMMASGNAPAPSGSARPAGR